MEANMSTPVGHTLTGLSICFLHEAVCKKLGRFRRLRRFCIRYSLKGYIFAGFLACLPDIDFIPGVFTGDINQFHHCGTHSLGFAVIVSLSVWLIAKAKKIETADGWGLISFLLIMSHLGVDYLTIDKRAPFGIPFLWPLSGKYFYFRYAFLPYTVRYASVGSGFNIYNLRTVLYEFLIYLPLAIICRKIK